MRYLLNLAYLSILVAASPWLVWHMCRHGKYRHGLPAKLLGLVPRRESSARCLWLHAVSVGEVNLLVPLVAQIAGRWPDWECVISTTSRTGYDVARVRFPERQVFYFPLDFTWAVRRALDRIRPDLLVLSELELWPNLIAAAQRSSVPVAIINGRLSDRSLRGYRRLGSLVTRTLDRLSLVAAQTPEYAQRFRQLGARDSVVHVTGSIKFDGARTDRHHPETRRLCELAGIGPADIVFLAGSTQAPEEALALATFRRWSTEFPRLRLILVPRHPERFAEVATLLSESGLGWQRRSELTNATAGNPASPRILLVDQIGELRAWWGAAQIGFVGGSFGARGGQNMIEPAAYGCAVSFGPNTKNFRDVVELLRAEDAARIVQSGDELTEFVGRCLAEPQFAAELGERAQRAVRTQCGATERTIELLEALRPATRRTDRSAA